MPTPFFESLYHFINAQDPKLSNEERATQMVAEFTPDSVLSDMLFKTLSHSGNQNDFLIGESEYNTGGYPTPLRSLKGLSRLMEETFSMMLSMRSSLTITVDLTDEQKIDFLENNFNAAFALGGDNSLSCCDCGVNLRYEVDFEAMEIRPSKSWEKRIREQGLPTICTMVTLEPKTIIIPTPSKKLVMANDLRSLFPEADTRKYIKDNSNGRSSGVNDRLGRELHTEYWEEQGMMYFDVGNTSPTVFVDGDNLMVARELDEDIAYYRDNASPENLKEIESVHAQQEDMTSAGYISTDLWALTAIDYDLFIKRANKMLMLTEQQALVRFDPVIINVPDDTIALTSHYELNEEDEILFIRASLKPKQELSLENKSTSPKP